MGNSNVALQTVSAEASGGSLQLAMQTFTAQWYNAVTASLNLSPSTFQLTQGNTLVGNLTQNLWAVFDSVPPLSLNQLFNPAQLNAFSGDYGAIITNLTPPGTQKFENDMGDFLSPWQQFLNGQTSLPQGGILSLFQTWSALHMPAGQAQLCTSDLEEILDNPISVAQTMWHNASSPGTGGVFAYNISIEAVRNQLSQAPSGTVKMNSLQQSSNTSGTWAQGTAVTAADNLFNVSGDASFSDLSSSLLQAGLNITVELQNVATVPAGPLSQPSGDPNPPLNNAQPWFNPAAFQMAFQAPSLWNPQPPTWASMFGPGGSLQRNCSALVIVDGVTITITSNVGFSSAEQTQFEAAAEVGFWPFFAAQTSTGWVSNSSWDDSGNLTYTVSSPPGNSNQLILGAVVTPISDIFTL